MPKKNRKSVEPVPLAAAMRHFHPRNERDYIDKVVEDRKKLWPIKPAKGSDDEYDYHFMIVSLPGKYADAASRIDFWFDIKEGKLILVGYSDRGDGNLVRLPMHILEDPARSVSLPKGKISGSGLCFVNVGVLKPSEAKKVPEFCRAKEEQPERPEPPKASKGTPGPKPKYDWDAAVRELVTLAEKSDELPRPKARIVAHLADWFNEHYNDIPSDSLLRAHVGNWLPLDYHDRE